MGSKGTRGGKGGGAGAGAATQTETNTAPFDNDLIRRANAAGTFVDYGDAGVRQYNRLSDEINGMDLTDEEKRNAISQLHGLIENQLEAESHSFSPYSYGVGPARFNAKKIQSASDKASKAEAKVNTFMEGLRQEQRAKKLQNENNALADAARKALADGALEFTVNGQTWRRKTRRAKSFTAD